MNPAMKCGDRFEICDPDRGWMSDRVLQSGKRLEHSLPSPLKSFLPRLLASRLLLREIPPQTTASIAAIEGHTLIELKLAGDEVVVTHIPRLVGIVGAAFNGGKITTSLTALSLGHSILHTVKGPGSVYFESSSRSVKLITGDNASQESFDPSSIICFGAGSEFVVTSGKKFWSLFAGNWQLELKSGWVVIDVGFRGKERGIGIGPLLRRVYLPWS